VAPGRCRNAGQRRGCCTEIKFLEISKDVHLKYHELPEVSHVTAFSKGYNFTTIPFKLKTDTILSDAIHESMKNALLGSSEVFIGGIPLLIEAMHF